MGERLYKAQVPDLLSLHREVATFRSKVCNLAESHVPIIYLVIPSTTQILPTPPALIFNLFADEDES